MYWIVEICCPTCKKIFVPAPHHVYKDGDKTYCTWTCFNHREQEPKKSCSRAVLMYDMHGNLVEKFTSAVKAADRVQGNPTHLRDACKHSKRYKGYFWRYDYDLPKMQ